MKNISFVIFTILGIQASAACYNDYDCGSGNKCVKSFGNYGGGGVCVGQQRTQVDTSMYNTAAPNYESAVDSYQRAQMNALMIQRMRLENQRMQAGGQ